MKTKTFDTIEEITCPYCGELQGYEVSDNGAELTTYWGEESVDGECHNCGKKFIIQEQVRREWEVAKTIMDL